jgi:hypothetical protein
LERFHWIFCGPTGTPNSLDMSSTLAMNRRIENARKYFFRVLGAWRLNLAAARRRYAQRLSQEFPGI